MGMIFKLFARACVLLVTHLPTILQLSLIPVVIAIAPILLILTAIEGIRGAPDPLTLSLTVAAALFFCLIMLWPIMAWQRFALLGERSMGFMPHVPKHAYWTYVWHLALITLLAIGLSVILLSVFAGITAVSAAAGMADL